MRLKKINWLTVLVAIESVLFLVPTTLFYLMFIITVIGALFTGSPGDNPMRTFLLLPVLVVLPGYALYALYWLLHHYRGSAAVPKHIWAGIVVGVAVAISGLFLYAILPLPPELMAQKGALFMIRILGGPLLLTLTLLLIIRPWRNLRSTKRPDSQTASLT